MSALLPWLVVLAWAGLCPWWFFRRMNRGEVVRTEHGPGGEITAVEYFWRPG